MNEPFPHAGEADIAEQARLVDDGIDDEYDPVPDELGENRDADAGDLLDQQLSVSGHDDDHTLAVGRVAGGVSLASLGIQFAHDTTVVHRRHGLAERAIPARLVKIDVGGEQRRGDYAGSSAGRVLQLATTRVRGMVVGSS